MTVSTLQFADATDADDASEFMWFEDMSKLAEEHEEYERQRMDEARRLRLAARDLMDQAAAHLDPRERDTLVEQAQQKLHLANDPLPQQRKTLERLEQALVRSCGQPAVLVRPSLPRDRDVYHSGPDCGLIAGEGRHLKRAGWTPVGEAETAGYRPCERCGATG